MIHHIENFKNGVSGKVNETVGVIKAKSIERIDINNVRYELHRNIQRVDYEFNRRIHIFLLSIFFVISTLFIAYSYLAFGVMTMLYSIIVFTVALVGENMVSRTGTYTYNMEHKPVVGRVPLFIPFLWLALNLGSLFLAYIMLQTAGISNGLIIAFTSATIPLFIDLLLLEPKLSRERNVWIWKDTTRLYAPYGNYVVWFAFPFLANLGFLLALM